MELHQRAHDEKKSVFTQLTQRLTSSSNLKLGYSFLDNAFAEDWCAKAREQILAAHNQG